MILHCVTSLILTTAVLLGAVWRWRRRAPAPREVGWNEVMAAADRGGYRLISTEEMADRYLKNSQSLLLVDTRPEREYRAGHIEGAVNFPLIPTWWGRCLARKALSKLLGPDKERLVVFY
jgi:hypothetical protein